MWGIHDKCGGISWVPWGVQYHGGIMSTVVVSLSTVGISWCTWGISWVPWRVFSTMGEKSFVIWVPHGTEHPHGTHDISPHASWYPPTVLKFQRMVSPTVLMVSPTCIMISPTVLNIPYGTQDNPHGTHNIPTVLNIPHGTQDIPTFIMISPWYWTPPRYSRYPPTVLMISSTVLMISPTVLNTPQSTAHTLYRVRTGIFTCGETCLWSIYHWNIANPC